MNKAILLVFSLILIACTYQNKTHKGIAITDDNHSLTSILHKNDTDVFVYYPQKIENIVDTKWIVKIDSNCIDSLIFKKDTVISYNCELGEFDLDPFLIRNDTIIINEYDYIHEMDTSEVFIGPSYFVIFENKLILVFSFRFDENGNKIEEHRIKDKPRVSDVSYYEKN